MLEREYFFKLFLNLKDCRISDFLVLSIKVEDIQNINFQFVTEQVTDINSKKRSKNIQWRLKNVSNQSTRDSFYPEFNFLKWTSFTASAACRVDSYFETANGTLHGIRNSKPRVKPHGQPSTCLPRV